MRECRYYWEDDDEAELDAVESDAVDPTESDMWDSKCHDNCDEISIFAILFWLAGVVFLTTMHPR
jgi:hypothetical protein